MKQEDAVARHAEDIWQARELWQHGVEPLRVESKELFTGARGRCQFYSELDIMGVERKTGRGN